MWNDAHQQAASCEERGPDDTANSHPELKIAEHATNFPHFIEVFPLKGLLLLPRPK
jgi:hypothetical protein